MANRRGNRICPRETDSVGASSRQESRKLIENKAREKYHKYNLLLRPAAECGRRGLRRAEHAIIEKAVDDGEHSSQ